MIIKQAIDGAVAAGVPVNTIILLLLLPVAALVIAAIRNLVGIRGFGILLPAALAVVFVAIGPLVGIGLFLLIVVVSTLVRLVLRKLKIKLLYLPRMALIFWAVAVAVLGVVRFLGDISIFAVLISILLTEDFIRVQLGKSAKTAIHLTAETLVIALAAFLVLTFKTLGEFALSNPEITLISVGILDIALAKYSGLRLMEIWRFRKLIRA